ncbi:MAG: hypothetical protein QOH63_1270 [Acidobacteriota bacterium]|nr:hypothetical protein [Acidobacteriota bacterium]
MIARLIVIGKRRKLKHPCGLISSFSSLALERLTDSRQSLFVIWKTQPVFPGNDRFANPDRELAPVAFGQSRLNPKLFLKQRRHTGGARQVVSNDAVAYGNLLHCGNLLQ